SSRSPEAPDYIRFSRIDEFLARRWGRWSEAIFGIGPQPPPGFHGNRRTTLARRDTDHRPQRRVSAHSILCGRSCRPLTSTADAPKPTPTAVSGIGRVGWIPDLRRDPLGRQGSAVTEMPASGPPTTLSSRSWLRLPSGYRWNCDRPTRELVTTAV